MLVCVLCCFLYIILYFNTEKDASIIYLSPANSILAHEKIKSKYRKCIAIIPKTKTNGSSIHSDSSDLSTTPYRPSTSSYSSLSCSCSCKRHAVLLFPYEQTSSPTCTTRLFLPCNISPLGMYYIRNLDDMHQDIGTGSNYP